MLSEVKMYIDRQDIRNMISPENLEEIALCKSVTIIENVIICVVEKVLAYQKKKREERTCNITDYIDIHTDKYDKQGRRRFSLKAVDDEPVMCPDKNGFWTPVDG